MVKGYCKIVIQNSLIMMKKRSYFNILTPFLHLRVFLPFVVPLPLIKESLESESELGIILMPDPLSRSSYKKKKS